MIRARRTKREGTGRLGDWKNFWQVLASARLPPPPPKTSAVKTAAKRWQKPLHEILPILQSPCALSFLFVAGCSSSSAGPAADAGRPEAAAPVDAGHESGSGFPIDDSGPPDAGSECDQLRAQVTALETTARACNPQGVSECGAAVDGICCPITVSISNNGPVNDFTQAVLNYKQKCNPDCSKVICGTAPTNVCEGMGNQGLCAATL